MSTTEIKSKIEAEFNRYSQQFDIIQGPQIRHEFSQFLNEIKDLPDTEFLQKVNERYGLLFEYLYKERLLGYLKFFKIVCVVFVIVPVVIGIIYNLLIRL